MGCAEWLCCRRRWAGTAKGKGEGTEGQGMVMAALDDINGDCETAPMCSARHLKLNEFLDPIKHGPEKSITTTEKVETSSITWGRT